MTEYASCSPAVLILISQPTDFDGKRIVLSMLENPNCRNLFFPFCPEA